MITISDTRDFKPLRFEPKVDLNGSNSTKEQIKNFISQQSFCIALKFC